MSEEIDPKRIEEVASLIDPKAWADNSPVPTRSDFLDFHERRQYSAGIAKAILIHIQQVTNEGKGK